jgi:hypothetical protein
MRYIEWRLDSSDLSDMEGFQVVSRRTKKEKKKKSLVKVNIPKGKSPQPSDGIDPLEGDISSHSTRYYSLRLEI